MQYSNRHNIHSLRPIVERRRAILVEIIRQTPGLTTLEVFKQWHQSQARKDAGLLAVHTEADLLILEQMEILRSEKKQKPGSTRMVKSWFLKRT